MPDLLMDEQQPALVTLLNLLPRLPQMLPSSPKALRMVVAKQLLDRTMGR